MNILIIEDEIETAWDIQHCIKSVRPHFRIEGVADSIESGVEWMSMHAAPDLIISDIQLGDGLAFDIFKKAEIKCPVIFCTAFDEYAIQAFQNNGIDYLLKPINEQLVEKSLCKVESFVNSSKPYYDNTLLDKVIKTLEEHDKHYKTNFLATYRNQMIPLHASDIAFFQVGENGTKLHTKDNSKYTLKDTLDHLESVLDPTLFFRANRQFLIAYSAIKHIEYYDDRKLLVKVNLPNAVPIVVSKAKASLFLSWVEER